MTVPDPPPRLIVGISGASGSLLGIRLLQALRPLPVQTHLVMTRAAETTLAHESDVTADAVRALADVVHAPDDMAAGISSGSFRTLGMIVAPCSIKTLGEIATGVTSGLIARAADVVLKERRRLVLLVRETPLHLGHLRSMAAVTEMGAIVMPPVPAFYARPATIEAMVDQTVARALDLAGVEGAAAFRWREDQAATPPRS